MTLLVACDGGAEEPPVAGATTSPGSSVSTGPGGLPTGSPGLTGSVSEGRATVMASGGLEASAQLSLTFPAVYAPPPGGLALAWSDDDGEGLTLVGTAFTGTEPTSPTLQLSFSLLRGNSKELFSSTDGTCRVTVDQADQKALAGSFSCSNLPARGGGITIDATGSFTATGS